MSTPPSLEPIERSGCASRHLALSVAAIRYLGDVLAIALSHFRQRGKTTLTQKLPDAVRIDDGIVPPVAAPRSVQFPEEAQIGQPTEFSLVEGTSELISVGVHDPVMADHPLGR